MKNVLSFSVVTFCAVLQSWAQPNYQWAGSAGGNTYDEGHAIAADAAGNTYVAGYFQNTADFDPGPGITNLVAAGNKEAFLAKYSSAGALLWANKIGSTGEDNSFGVSVDASGNALITGYFNLTVDFDPGPGVYNLTSVANQDIFFAKYDGSGNFVWAHQLGGSGNEWSYSITSDANDDVYVTGIFFNTIDFDPGPGVVNYTAQSGDLFIAKYDAAGNYVWAKDIRTSNWTEGRGIKADNAGNVYVTGSFDGTTDFDPGAGTLNLTGLGLYDTFFAKYDASGNVVWAKSVGNADFAQGFGIDVDASGNVLISGLFQNTVDFDPGPGTFNMTGAGSNDTYFAKYDSNGNFVWAKKLGCTNNDISRSIAVDAAGSVYITGYFQGTCDFDPGAGVSNLSPYALMDVYYAKYDASGNFLWAKQIGTSGYDEGWGITVNASGFIYVTGYFEGTADFDPGPGTANRNSVSYDVYFAKYNDCLAGPSQPGVISGSTTVCENTTNTYSITAVTGAISYTWTLPGGWSGSSTTNSINATAGANSGSISVTANNACGSSVPRTLAVQVNNVPAQPAVISGSTTICANTTNTYSITAVNGAIGYTWTLPNGWTGSSNTTSIVATANGAGGNITVTADNGCGSGTAQTLAVTVNTAPATPGAISGPAIICENSTNTYSVSAVNGATSYTWTLPNGWSGTSTTNSISATANGSSGNITVTATNSCGTSQAQTLAVMVNPVYVTNTTAAICQGDSMLLAGAYQKTAGSYTDPLQTIYGCDSTVITALTINPLPTVTLASQTAVCSDAAAFNLTGGLPAGGTYSGTGVSNNQFDPTVAGAGTHTITYTYTDANTGCSNSATNTIVVNPLPPVPTITANGNTFTSSSATGNQWYMNGNPVNGATNQTFTCTGNGNYSVCVTDANGCKSCSQVLNFTTFGIAEDQTGNTVTVYPNPFNTLFTVIASEAKQSTILIYNTLGEVVYSNQIANQPLTIDLSEAPTGIYFVQVRTTTGVFSKRIVKE